MLPSSLTRKLAPKWIGPYLVKRIINPVAVELDLPPNLKLHPVLHVSQLKPHHGQDVQLEQPVFEIEGELEYEVEAIVGHRYFRGNVL